jgi:cation transport regulator
MPYSSPKELPPQVQRNLPPHAQEIYQKAFNNAWKEYADPDRRQGNESREEAAHKVAWSAVEQAYTKDQYGNWKKREK